MERIFNDWIRIWNLKIFDNLESKSKRYSMNVKIYKRNHLYNNNSIQSFITHPAFQNFDIFLYETERMMNKKKKFNFLIFLGCYNIGF